MSDKSKYLNLLEVVGIKADKALSQVIEFCEWNLTLENFQKFTVMMDNYKMHNTSFALFAIEPEETMDAIKKGTKAYQGAKKEKKF